MKVLFFGDVVGQLGCAAFQKHARQLKERFSADIILVNGENSASSGRGITPRLVSFFKHAGADLITSGNHIWGRKEILEYLQDHTDLIRPANFSSRCPGKGVAIVECGGVRLGVINVQGLIFMREHLDNPFTTVDSLLTYLKDKTNAVIVDFHAETTAEKIGMGLYLDGRVAAVVGTHTHVQTADERILPKGTAFITDLGMCGALNGMIGMKKESVLPTMLTQMPNRFVVDTDPPAVVSGVCITIDQGVGLATDIEKFRIVDEELYI